jgi:glutaredoxin
MRIETKTVLAFLSLLMASFPAFSQVYKWKDKDGNLVISTTPPPPGVQYENRKLGESGPSDSEAGDKKAGKSTIQEVDLVRENRDIKVIIYMADWCPACRQAIKFLNSLDVDLRQYDVDKDPEKNEEYKLKRKEWHKIPLIDIEGIVLRGCNETAVKNALNERKRAGVQY